MPQFTDTTGKGWTVRVSYNGIRAVRDECDGLDLLRCVAPGSEILDDLAYDHIATIQVLWAMVKGQACDVTYSTFEESMPPGRVEAGFVALTEALSLFFEESEAEGAVDGSMTTIRETRKAATEFTRALGDQMRVMDTKLEAANQTQQILNALRRTSPDSSGDLPADSDLIQDHSVSENSG